MGKGLNEFLTEDIYGMGTWDIKRLLELPLGEFRQRYIEDMQKYFDNHPNPVVICSECSEDVTSPENLVRRYGNNLHVNCFREIYRKKRGQDERHSQEYFDLVLDSLE